MSVDAKSGPLVCLVCLQKSAIPSADELQLYSFNFNDMHLDEDGTLKAVIRMFQEANIISTFKVPYEVRLRLVCALHVCIL